MNDIKDKGKHVLSTQEEQEAGLCLALELSKQMRVGLLSEWRVVPLNLAMDVIYLTEFLDASAFSGFRIPPGQPDLEASERGVPDCDAVQRCARKRTLRAGLRPSAINALQYAFLEPGLPFLLR